MATEHHMCDAGHECWVSWKTDMCLPAQIPGNADGKMRSEWSLLKPFSQGLGDYNLHKIFCGKYDTFILTLKFNSGFIIVTDNSSIIFSLIALHSLYIKDHYRKLIFSGLDDQYSADIITATVIYTYELKFN